MSDGMRRIGVLVVGLLLTVSIGGCGGERASTEGATLPTVAAARPSPDAASVGPSSQIIAEGLGISPTPSRKPTTSPRPKPSRKPPAETTLPPAPPKPSPEGCTPKYVGEQASRAQAKQALVDAAGRTYWPNSAPSIKVPVNMVKAVAWQESGWQSNIIACDGGVGLMQVMQGTADYVNMRFDQSYDIDDYRDNAALGANYLAWLIKYFGDVYFSDDTGEADYTLYTDGECASHTAPCLINAVLAAYNYGFGAVDTDQGLVIPNPRYVENVRALMTECECLAF